MAKNCPQCEKENPNSANVCMFCGTRLVENFEMDKIDALHSELSETKETIRLLKKALADAQTKKISNDEITNHAKKETFPPKTYTEKIVERNRPEEKPLVKQQYPAYNNPKIQNNKISNPGKKVPYAILTLVLGIISFSACFIYGIGGIICSIIGLVLASKGTAVYKANPSAYSQGSYKTLNAGRVCAIIGLILSIVTLIAYLIIVYLNNDKLL